MGAFSRISLIRAVGFHPCFSSQAQTYSCYFHWEFYYLQTRLYTIETLRVDHTGCVSGAPGFHERLRRNKRVSHVAHAVVPQIARAVIPHVARAVVPVVGSSSHANCFLEI